MKKILTAAFAAAMAIAAVSAAAQEPSNIGLDRYPAPKCDKPAPAAAKPASPPENPDSDQAEAYNRKVAAYNAATRARNGQVVAFDACMKSYVAAANADAQRIQAAVNAAVTAANAN